MGRARWMVVLMLCGCGGGGGGGGGGGSLGLVRSQCGQGGIVLETGSDLDGNGALDETEMGALYVFCLASRQLSCATDDPSKTGHLTWWDGEGRLVARATCGPERR